MLFHPLAAPSARDIQFSHSLSRFPVPAAPARDANGVGAIRVMHNAAAGTRLPGFAEMAKRIADEVVACGWGTMWRSAVHEWKMEAECCGLIKLDRHLDKAADVVWHHATVTRERREQQNGHRSAVLWFTGLSSSGKSTLAHAVEERLHQSGYRAFVFDGDNVRHGLCRDLGFSEAHRAENVRRVAEVAKLFVEAGIITMTALISPFHRDREAARAMFAHGDFIEVYCDCPLAICEERDVKGLYRRARAGEIAQFTGLTSPYEPPQDAELVLATGELLLDESVEAVIALLRSRGVIPVKA